MEGEANWFSGVKLPKGLFYCPISLAFQPHIDHIDASNKLHEVVRMGWRTAEVRYPGV